MGFHGVQLLGLAIICYGIYDTFAQTYATKFSIFPMLGLIVVIAGVFVDPFVEAMIHKGHSGTR